MILFTFFELYIEFLQMNLIKLIWLDLMNSDCLSNLLFFKFKGLKLLSSAIYHLTICCPLIFLVFSVILSKPLLKTFSHFSARVIRMVADTS